MENILFFCQNSVDYLYKQCFYSAKNRLGEICQIKRKSKLRLV